MNEWLVQIEKKWVTGNNSNDESASLFFLSFDTMKYSVFELLCLVSEKKVDIYRH
jgi:hypothetical protein